MVLLMSSRQQQMHSHLLFFKSYHMLFAAMSTVLFCHSLTVLYSVVPFGPCWHAQGGRGVLAHGIEVGDDGGFGVSAAGGGARVDGHEGVETRVFVEHATVGGVDFCGRYRDGAAREESERKEGEEGYDNVHKGTDSASRV